VDVKYDSELVEYIVREVIRRLAADGRYRLHASSQPPVRSQELNLTDRLVTLATLHGKLDGVTQITTARNSVITPAVRDELKNRKIVLKRG